MVFDFLKKKKKKEDLPLPPPPQPPKMQPVLKGDIEPIRAPAQQRMPPAPEAPEGMEPLPPQPPEPPAPQPPQPPVPPTPEPPQEQPPQPQYPFTPTPPKTPTPPPPVVHEELPELPEKTVHDKTIKEEPEPETIHAPIKPAFVAVDDYKRIINDTNTVRAKLMDAEQFVKRLTDLKNEEERTFDKWRGQLEDVEKKLSYVDQLIAQAQR